MTTSTHEVSWLGINLQISWLAMFHLFSIEAMEFRPRILVPKVGGKNSSFWWEDIYLILNCWSFLLNKFRREFSCLIGKLIRLKMLTMLTERSRPQHFFPWKKVVGLRFWMLNPPPFPQQKIPHVHHMNQFASQKHTVRTWKMIGRRFLVSIFLLGWQDLRC